MPLLRRTPNLLIFMGMTMKEDLLVAMKLGITIISLGVMAQEVDPLEYQFILK